MAGGGRDKSKTVQLPIHQVLSVSGEWFCHQHKWVREAKGKGAISNERLRNWQRKETVQSLL